MTLDKARTNFVGVQTLGVGAGLRLAPTPSGSRSGPRWFCAATRSHEEFRALNELEAQKFPTYLPLHLDRSPKKPERIVPLFPGYLFVSFDPNVDQWRCIASTRGIWAILGDTPEKPKPIPHGVVEKFIERTSARRIVDDPGQARDVIYQKGDLLRVAGGAFKEFEGVCLMSTKDRVKVLLSLFGRPTEVQVPVNLVEAV